MFCFLQEKIGFHTRHLSNEKCIAEKMDFGPMEFNMNIPKGGGDKHFPDLCSSCSINNIEIKYVSSSTWARVHIYG